MTGIYLCMFPTITSLDGTHFCWGVYCHVQVRSGGHVRYFVDNCWSCVVLWIKQPKAAAMSVTEVVTTCLPDPQAGPAHRLVPCEINLRLSMSRILPNHSRVDANLPAADQSVTNDWCTCSRTNSNWAWLPRSDSTLARLFGPFYSPVPYLTFTIYSIIFDRLCNIPWLW